MLKVRLNIILTGLTGIEPEIATKGLKNDFFTLVRVLREGWVRRDVSAGEGVCVAVETPDTAHTRCVGYVDVEVKGFIGMLSLCRFLKQVLMYPDELFVWSPRFSVYPSNADGPADDMAGAFTSEFFEGLLEEKHLDK